MCPVSQGLFLMCWFATDPAWGVHFLPGHGRGLQEGQWTGAWEAGARYLGGAVPVQSAGLAGSRPPARQCVVAGIGKALGVAATLRQIWGENKVPYSIIRLPWARHPRS